MGGWTIAWTNPALAIGALGLLVPYLVHLLTRRTPRTLVFPTVQFLKRAKADQSALLRLRDIVLLLVRTAFVAALVLAFLKPVWRARAMAGDDGRRQAAVAIVDASLSMQHANGAPFARAQQSAEKLIDRIAGEGLLNIIFAGAAPVSSREAPAASGAPLRRDLLAAAAGPERADLDAALAEAVRQLEGFPDHARSIYLVSDFQRTNWSAVKFSAVPENIKVVFVPVGDRVASNTAVIDVTVRPRTPVVSETVEVVCSVANYGGAPIELPVTLQLSPIGPAVSSDRDRSERTIALAPGASGAATFRFRAASTGSFEGVVKIPGDALDADNVRYFTLDVRDRIDVALVSDVADSARSSAHFVWRALDPFGASEGTQRASAIRVRAVRARDLDLGAESPQVLVIDGPGAMSEKAVAQISEYVKNGGAVIYFLSDALDKGSLDAIAFAAKDDFAAPFALATMLDRGEAAGALAEVRAEDPIFRRFRDSGEISAMTFKRYFVTERNEGRGEVLARYDDGNFALGKATLGAGVLLLCNFSAGRDASDLAQRPAFVPFVHEMAKSVRPREGSAARAIVGYTASGSVPATGPGSGLLILSPSGENVSATVERRAQRLAVIVQPARETGFYRVNDGTQHLGSLPVNSDARESDLLPLTESQLGELAAAPGRKVASAAARSTRALGALIDGVPIWPYLLVLALALLAVEHAALAVLRR